MGIDQYIFNKISSNDVNIDELNTNIRLFFSLIDDIEFKNNEWHIYEKRARVDEFNGLKIEVFPNEHTPPHFHVQFDSQNASFRIDDCELLDGYLSPKVIRKLKYWYNGAGKSHIINYWNKLRPTNDIIGKVD